MKKAEQFNKWYADHCGHPHHVRFAKSAIDEQQQEIAELKSMVNALVDKSGLVFDDMIVLFSEQKPSREDGSYLVDGQSCHELQLLLDDTPAQCLVDVKTQAITDAIFNSEHIEVDGHKYVGLEDLEVNIKQLGEQK